MSVSKFRQVAEWTALLAVCISVESNIFLLGSWQVQNPVCILTCSAVRDVWKSKGLCTCVKTPCLIRGNLRYSAKRVAHSIQWIFFLFLFFLLEFLWNGLRFLEPEHFFFQKCWHNGQIQKELHYKSPAKWFSCFFIQHTKLVFF